MELHNRSVRTDVRELGALLGDVLAAQTSTAAYETVEDLRTAAIAYRQGDAESRDALYDAIDDLSGSREGIVARAFTTYFELINLAEERERVRAVRNAESAGAIHDSFAETIATFAEEGVERGSSQTSWRRCSETSSSSRRSPHIRPRRGGRRSNRSSDRSRTSSKSSTSSGSPTASGRLAGAT